MAQIKAQTNNSLKYALDCVSEPATMAFCYRCLGRTGGKLTTLEPPPKSLKSSRPKTTQVDWVLGPTLLGKTVGWPEPMTREADPAMREFAKLWYTTAQQLLDQGKLRSHPLRVMDGGLLAALDGLELLKNKQVSGQKLICHV